MRAQGPLQARAAVSLAAKGFDHGRAGPYLSLLHQRDLISDGHDHDLVSSAPTQGPSLEQMTQKAAHLSGAGRAASGEQRTDTDAFTGADEVAIALCVRRAAWVLCTCGVGA